jgi:hypothetical protein
VVARERAQNAHTSVTKMSAARRADRRVGRPRPGDQGRAARRSGTYVLGQSVRPRRLSWPAASTRDLHGRAHGGAVARRSRSGPLAALV